MLQKHLNLSSLSLNKPDKKSYIPTWLNKQRIVGLVDSGSDVSILHFSLFRKIFGQQTKIDSRDTLTISTFSNTQISVLGKFKTLIKLSPNHPGIPLEIWIIDDITNCPPLLLGLDLIVAGLGSISMTGTVTKPIPKIMFNHPYQYDCTVYFTSPTETNYCYAYCNLDAGEMSDIEVTLNNAFQGHRKDHVLISALNFEPLTILPSHSDITYDSGLDTYIANVRVVNTSTSAISGFITGKCEVVNNFMPIQLTDKNDHELKCMLLNNPLGREILNTSDSNFGSFPIITVNSLNSVSYSEMSPNDNPTDFCETFSPKEPVYDGDADIGPHLLDCGIEMPTRIFKNAEEAIPLNSYEPDIQKYIRDIFIDKFPNTVSLSPLDAGNISMTLGYIKLNLREGEILPRAKRLFHISPNDAKHLQDILDLLLEKNYIQRTPVNQNGSHLYGLAAYLVPRAKPGAMGRLIVDFSPINNLLESTPAIIPEINSVLQQLQGKSIFSSLDLRYAYMSIMISEDSRNLTTFLTPSGSFQWVSLPTGLAGSPSYFCEFVTKILHFEPVLDREGNPIYESQNCVKLKPSPLEHTNNFFDDVLTSTPLKNTYAETLEQHFHELSQVIARLSFHGSKINIAKCEFGVNKIKFLGWYICQDYVIADPARIKKIKEFVFPNSKKGIRAFLGLINSLRRVLTLDVADYLQVLTPLTSSKTPYEPNEEHRHAFEELKKILISRPLFNNLIHPQSKKYLFVDASTSTCTLGAVLAQQKITVKDEKILPESLSLADPVHRIIYDLELNFEPVKLYTEWPIILPKPSERRTIPPNILPTDPLLGYTAENVNDSFFWSTLSILSFLQCILPGPPQKNARITIEKN